MFGGWIAATLTIVIWGVTFASTRVLLKDFSSLEILVLRFSMAWLTLAALCGFRLKVNGGEMFVPGEGWRLKSWDRHDELLCAALGLTGLFANQFLENCAIDYTNASNVVILVSFGPIVTAALARLVVRGSPLTPGMLLGSAVAIAGVILVSLNGVINFHLRPLGDVMALGAMLCWAAYSLIVDRANVRGIPPFVALRKAFFWALVLMLPSILFGITDCGRQTLSGSFAITLDAAANVARFSRPENGIHLVFLGVFASAICYSLWSVACRRLGMVRTTMGLYLLPVIGVAFAAIFLDEPLTWPTLAGAVLILVGVIGAERGKPRDERVST